MLVLGIAFGIFREAFVAIGAIGLALCLVIIISATDFEVDTLYDKFKPENILRTEDRVILTNGEIVVHSNLIKFYTSSDSLICILRMQHLNPYNHVCNKEFQVDFCE